MIDAIELRERLQYDPNTGRWVWLKTPRKGFEGKPAGSIDAKGYWVIKIDGQSYKASRLAYLWMTGEWPAEEMDHIDRTPWNDVWTNIRPASRTENNLNREMPTSSGHKGVRKHSSNNSYTASYDNIYIGSYKTIEEAVSERDAFIVRLEAFRKEGVA